MGQKSRAAGISLSVASLAFLGLSLYFRNNVVFQIDSIVCLLAAIAVFLRGERSSMQLRIVHRMLESSNQILDEVSSLSFGKSPVFNYVPLGEKLTDVVVAPISEVSRPTALQTSTNGQSVVSPLVSNVTQVNLIPPGRSLAELYRRELNLPISNDLLVQSLRTIICERFELGSSVTVQEAQDGKSIEITLDRPAVRQSCMPSDSDGMIGCPISSMLAVLFCQATKRVVSLMSCKFDEEENKLKIHLSIGEKPF